MGKYTKFRGKLPDFELEPDFREKVDKAKEYFLQGASLDQAGEANIARLMRMYRARRIKKDKLKAEIRKINVDLEALSQLFVTYLEDNAAEKVTLERSGVTISIKDEPFPSVNDRAQLFAWIKKTKQIQLLSVQWQTLKGLVGELLSSGKNPPPGVKVFIKTSAQCRGLNLNEEE